MTKFWSPEAQLRSWTVTLRSGETIQVWAHGHHADGVEITFGLMLSEAAAELLRRSEPLAPIVELGTVDGTRWFELEVCRIPGDLIQSVF